MKTSNYMNRELSWIEFDKRVLHEARDKSTLLFERLKFLSITSSNLDEFFMVRVASLKDMVTAKYAKKDISGMTAREQLEVISKKTHELVDTQYSTYKRSLVPALREAGLRIIEKHEDLSREEAEYVDRLFLEQIYPVLTPLAVDSSRPFPLVRNKSLNIAAFLKKKKNVKPLIKLAKKQKQEDEKSRADFAIVQVPDVLPRVVVIPQEIASEQGAKVSVIFLEQIIERNINQLFLNYEVVDAHPFRIMRNAEFDLDEDEAADLLEEIQKQLKKRQRGQAIRLEIESDVDKRLLKLLAKELAVDSDDLFLINGPLDLTVCMQLYKLDGFEKYKLKDHEPASVPELMNDDDIFANIRKQDILLMHPYQSFDPVVDFVRRASEDESVLAIKQTLYRVSGNSPIIAALARAAESGKQVTVLVELKARFDEEKNIIWARMLERAGCHVLYGLVGLKTHSKITLVVRREEDGIRRYVHLGTGNYNDSTAKLYTDIGLFTCDRLIGEDATAVFNMLSGYSDPPSWNKLVVAPLWMKNRFLALIEQARQAALAGKRATIQAKMNSLSDKDIIDALYAASAAGVKIDLIIRGICCLKVGISGISENITVRSIVGNFLEHARIFYFEIDTRQVYLVGSADWMSRNLDKRVEIVFPIDDENNQRRIRDYLQLELDDNVKASIYQPDTTYKKESLRGAQPINSQEILVRQARQLEKDAKPTHDRKRFFIPKSMSEQEE